jgi:hypothetical protein
VCVFLFSDVVKKDAEKMKRKLILQAEQKLLAAKTAAERRKDGKNDCFFCFCLFVDG